MTPEQRTNRARNAAKTRWDNASAEERAENAVRLAVAKASKYGYDLHKFTPADNDAEWIARMDYYYGLTPINSPACPYKLVGKRCKQFSTGLQRRCLCQQFYDTGYGDHAGMWKTREGVRLITGEPYNNAAGDSGMQFSPSALAHLSALVINLNTVGLSFSMTMYSPYSGNTGTSMYVIEPEGHNLRQIQRSGTGMYQR